MGKWKRISVSTMPLCSRYIYLWKSKAVSTVTHGEVSRSFSWYSGKNDGGFKEKTSCNQGYLLHASLKSFECVWIGRSVIACGVQAYLLKLKQTNSKTFEWDSNVFIKNKTERDKLVAQKGLGRVCELVIPFLSIQSITLTSQRDCDRW